MYRLSVTPTLARYFVELVHWHVPSFRACIHPRPAIPFQRFKIVGRLVTFEFDLWPLALVASRFTDRNEWPNRMQWFFFFEFITGMSLDRNYHEVINLLFVLPGLYLIYQINWKNIAILGHFRHVNSTFIFSTQITISQKLRTISQGLKSRVNVNGAKLVNLEERSSLTFERWRRLIVDRRKKSVHGVNAVH